MGYKKRGSGISKKLLPKGRRGEEKLSPDRGGDGNKSGRKRELRQRLEESSKKKIKGRRGRERATKEPTF